MSAPKICSICGGEIDVHANPFTGVVYWSEGHNAQPITDGRCCDECNTNIVIPIRILGRGEEE